MSIQFDGLCPLLQVFDMPESVRFYCDVLGFELASHSPLAKRPEGEYFHWAMLKRGDITIMLNTAYDEGERPPQPDPARIAAHGDTSLYFDCPDAERTCSDLVSLGVRVLEKPFITQYGLKRFTIADPDGYNLCFHGPANQ